MRDLSLLQANVEAKVLAVPFFALDKTLLLRTELGIGMLTTAASMIMNTSTTLLSISVCHNKKTHKPWVRLASNQALGLFTKRLKATCHIET